ncbi:MAG: glycerophosphodiester phosphodiesterase [Bacteroidia bacterium]|nr:glycerophosphodiester phosphodiesterase [Bacteroidia bacterium]
MQGCNSPKSIEIQGHRGCRGLLPENTVVAFLKAMDLGVNTLEMDVCVTGDHKVVVSHEPWMSWEICRDSLGNDISPDSAMNFNLYQMTYEQVLQFDCGSRVHPRFEGQGKSPQVKPLLSEVIAKAEAHGAETGRKLPLQYNIEIKTEGYADGIFHPAPAEFVPLVMTEILAKGIEQRTTVQSFDLRILQEMHRQYPQMALALLIENEVSPESNLKELGFTPQIYSPDFHLVDEHLVELCKAKGMRLIPWTVNEVEDMDRLVQLGVDGLITDYPDRAVGRFP